MGKTTKRLAILEEVVVCSVQYAEALEHVKPLLDSMEEKVAVIKDVSSDPEVMSKQDETAKVCASVSFYSTFTENIPNLILTGLN
jgi:hypothetical protein